MKKFLSVIAIVLALLMVVSCGDNTAANSGSTASGNGQDSQTPGGTNLTDNSGLVQYPTYPDELPRDYDYEVTVTKGDKTITLPVYNASRQKDSYHGVSDTDSYRRFCEFGFDGEVTVSVKVKNAMTSYAILPSSRKIQSSENNGVITFKLSEPQNIALRLNDDHNTILSIFAEPLETEAPKETDPNIIYFKAGLNNLSITAPRSFELNSAGVYKIPAGYTVYLEPGALVTARLTIDSGAQNVTIKGRGAVLDPRLDRVNSDGSYMLYAYKSSNISVEDVKFLDAHTFNLCFTDVQNLNIKNVKILSSEISTDGITTWGDAKTSNNDKIAIDGCYIYNNDNSFVITSAEDLKITNCVLGTAHAIFFPQGEVHDMQLDNIDVFRMGNFFRAKVEMNASDNVTWNISGKNIRAEDALTCNAFIQMSNQFDGEKKILFENVSLPQIITRDVPNIQAKNTKNATFECNNVFVNNGTKLDAKGILQEKDSSGITLKFGTSFDAAKAGVGSYAAAKKTVNFKGEPTITIGGYTVPFDAKGALEVEGYIPANNVLKAINNNKDTTKFVKEVDGVKMISLDFFRNSHKLNVTVDANGVKMSSPTTATNLLKNSGFEKISHDISFEMQYSTLVKSTDWSCFNFADLYIDSSPKSGKSAIKVFQPANKEAGDRGVVQFITPIIKQYGAGTYRFEAYVRLGTDTSAVKAAQIGLVQSSWQLDGAKNNLKNITLTNEWTKVVHEVTITDPNAEGYDRAFFFIGATAEKNQAIDIRIDDAALYFSK